MTKWFMRIFGSLLFLAAVTMVGFFAFWIWALQGRIQGYEISPDGFQIRHFTYYKPVFAKQGFWLDTWIETDFSSQLSGLGCCKIRAPVTWHLSSDNVTSIRSVDRHSEILTNLLQAQDEASGWLWIEWSKAHKAQAAKFWPIIQSMAFDKMYLTMPLVFRAAQEHQSLGPAEFETELRNVIADDLKAMMEEAQYRKELLKVAQWKQLLAKYSPSAGPIPAPEQLSQKEFSEFETDPIEMGETEIETTNTKESDTDQ